MALFGTKNNKAKESTKSAKTAAVPVAIAETASSNATTDSSHVLLNPRITEKATGHSAQGVYVFDIALDADKRQVAQAVWAIYKVTPSKVHIVTVPSKQKRSARTGKVGMKSGGKKAYVYLKRGDKITLA